MSSRRTALASHTSLDDDVDDAALDDLLGSDTENVSSRLNRGKPRRAPAASSTATSKRASIAAADTSRGDWDDHSDADKSPGSDDERPKSSRKSLSRPLPSRNRALPTKKPTAAGSSGTAGSMTDDLDSALFGLAGGSSATRATLAAPSEDAAAVQRPRSRSRTLETRRDDNGRPLSAASSRLDDEEEDDWDAPSGSSGSGMKPKAEEKRGEESRSGRTRPRSGLSIDDDVGQNLAQTMKQQKDDEHQEQQQTERGGNTTSDDASTSDRRARYREMMQKRREERASLSTQADIAPLAASPASTRRSNGKPPRPTPPPAADDPWSTLDDPLSSIGDQPSAADKIAQSLAAFGSGTQTAKEQPMPMARTQPLNAIAEHSGSALGGRRPRAMAGRRAPGLSASPVPAGDEPHGRPTTAPALQAAASTTPLPAAMKVEVTAADVSSSPTLPPSRAPPVVFASANTAVPTSTPFHSIANATASVPSFETWCQWLGLDAASSTDQPLLVVARLAAARPLPAHITHRDGLWHNSRTGKRSTEHPALGKWRKRLEQKQLAIKYNVDDDDSDEEPDSFWRDVDEQQAADERRQQQQSIPAEVAAVMSSSPAMTALTSSPFRSPLPAAIPTAASSFGQPSLPSFMSSAIVSTAHLNQQSPPMPALSLSAAAAPYSALPSSALIEEALAQQRTALTREFQQQLSDAIAHHMQLHTLTLAQRTKEDDDRRRREDERHRHEVAALREQL